MRKVIAVLVGLEFGALIIGFTFLTLIGYLISGVLAYVFGLVLPVEHKLLQSFFGYLISFIILSLSVFTCLKLSRQLHEYFKWIVITLPVCAGVIYFVAFRSIDKKSEVAQELEKYKISNDQPPPHYELYVDSLEEKLNKIASTEPSTSNVYLGIFSVNEEKVDSVIIDTLFLSPSQDLGVCVCSMKHKGHYIAVSIYFNPTENRVYSGSTISGEFSNSRGEALINCYYQLFIERKERKKATYSPEYRTWTESFPSILESEYWTKTIHEDTVNIRYYGER